MNNAEPLYLFADDQYLGQMETPLYDMWYIDGRWTAHDSLVATQFVELMQGQDVKHNMREWVGKYVEYATTMQGKRSPAIAYGFLEDLLVIRMLTHEETREHVRKNSL